MSRRQDKKIINNSHSETLLENKDDNKNLDKIIEDISNEDLSLIPLLTVQIKIR